ncbi:uncharacterized protein CCOS01_10689 [Colletotrichum costaricense]|uniref:Uncharacterized protein n=1 Tax=Colletotrichum costaricense TaxID=1209916 RepID=A0AAI9YRC3_9PEZI|nr:uncharacterized protein CCOS01_10689 [Colletotrichum costaricense]KAK1520570.1 hypothetical protein CCOS01_10689 [Colletotrichum costaricense]
MTTAPYAAEASPSKTDQSAIANRQSRLHWSLTCSNEEFWNNFYGRAISFGKIRDRETSDSMLPYPFLRSANRRGMSLKAMSTSDQPLRLCQRLPVREHRTTLHLPPLACTMREAISSMSIFIRAKSSAGLWRGLERHRVDHQRTQLS